MLLGEKLQSNIYILGFMGCGKSLVGKLLAGRLDWPYLDTDERIVQERRLSIPRIFEIMGEVGFRQFEKNLIERFSKLRKNVIALGGGSVLDPVNWDLISASGVTVSLDFPVKIIAQRLAGDKERPLLLGTNHRDRMRRIKDLMEQRKPFYQKADLVLQYTGEMTPEAIVNDVLDYLKGMS